MEKWNPRVALRAFETDEVTQTSAAYGELLSKCPVAYIEPASVDDRGQVGYWGIFGWDELTAAARETKVFSNVTPDQGPRVLPLQSDPPEHTAYRRILNPFFSAKIAGDIETRVRQYGGDMIDELVQRGSADFAQEFAFPFPTRVLCTFLGVPEEDWQFHHEWVLDMEHATGNGLLGPSEAVPAELFGRIVPYIQKLIESRRKQPGEDVVTGIINAEIGGAPIGDMDAISLVMTIMMAGHITTTSGIGGLIGRLARDPELQSFLRAHPDRIPDAVEESLRLDGPQQAMPRKCVADTEVSGEQIKAGEYVVLNFGSANVDPRHWNDADRFDLDRGDKRHVTFGRGLHQCIGQHLARMEMRLVTEELLARTRSFTSAGDVHRLTWPLTTVVHMPLRLEAV